MPDPIRILDDITPILGTLIFIALFIWRLAV